MSEKDRRDVYNEFKSGGCRVLISSDLFARGIDVQQVGIVINLIFQKVNLHIYTELVEVVDGEEKELPLTFKQNMILISEKN